MGGFWGENERRGVLGRGVLGGEEGYVLCLIYYGCCRGSVDCSAGRENCMLVESCTIPFLGGK